MNCRPAVDGNNPTPSNLIVSLVRCASFKNTSVEPFVIFPASAESKILATLIPLRYTSGEPLLTFAEWGTHTRPDFIVCGATGSPLRTTGIPLIYTVDCVANAVEVESHP